MAAMLCAVRMGFGADLRLVEAAERRDTAAVRALIALGANAATAQPDGATALHWAAHHGDVEVARALLAAGALVDAANDFGVTPLSLAVTHGSIRMVALLLASGARANLALPSGETPLMTAARAGSLDAVTLLLDRGAHVNHQESTKGQTALMWALFEDHVDVARFLADRGADIHLRSHSGMTPLLFAARQGNLDAVRLLLGRGARIDEPNADGVTPLLMATVRGHVADIELLLVRGADPNADAAGFTALHWAAGTWETSMTHDYPEAEGEWKALGGLQERKAHVITLLLAHGADINARAKKNPPRFGVNMFYHIKMAGATPFWIAAMSADVEVMRQLASRGADTTSPTADGVTPLMVAAGMGRVEGDSRIGDAQSVEAARLCLELGNAINAVSGSGETALHGAAWFGLDEVARFLVAQGADMRIKDRQQQTALDVAEGTTRSLLFRTHPSTAKVLRALADRPTQTPVRQD